MCDLLFSQILCFVYFSSCVCFKYFLHVLGQLSIVIERTMYLLTGIVRFTLSVGFVSMIVSGVIACKILVLFKI